MATPPSHIACLTHGTSIETPSGETPVEALTAGMPVSLARGGAATVTWVGRRRLCPATSPDPASVQPILISAGALGRGLPKRDLRLGPDTAIFVGLLLPVRLLVNGRSIVRLDVDTVDCLHIALDGHDVILAEQAPVATALDPGLRSLFANARVVDLRPAGTAITSPETLFDGEWLRAQRARLAIIADDLAGPDRAVG